VIQPIGMPPDECPVYFASVGPQRASERVRTLATAAYATPASLVECTGSRGRGLPIEPIPLVEPEVRRRTTMHALLTPASSRAGESWFSASGSRRSTAPHVRGQQKSPELPQPVGVQARSAMLYTKTTPPQTAPAVVASANGGISIKEASPCRSKTNSWLTPSSPRLAFGAPGQDWPSPLDELDRQLR